MVVKHNNDVMMGAIASQITSLTIIYSTVYSDADQRKHQSSASLAFVRGIHRGPVNSPYKWPVTRKMFPFDDVIMESLMDIWSIHQGFPWRKNSIDQKRGLYFLNYVHIYQMSPQLSYGDTCQIYLDFDARVR